MNLALSVHLEAAVPCLVELLLRNSLAVRAVPLYDSLGESAVEYTVNHSETSIIFAEASKMEFIAKAAGAIKKSVKQVVFWGSHACTDGASATVKKEASPSSDPLLSSAALRSPLTRLGASQASVTFLWVASRTVLVCSWLLCPCPCWAPHADIRASGVEAEDE